MATTTDVRVILLVYAAAAVPGAVLAAGAPGGAVLRGLTVAAWAAGLLGATALLVRRRAVTARAAGGLLLAALVAFLIGAGLVSVLIAGLDLVLALALLARAVRPASPRLRRLLLTLHVICTGTWLGVGAVMVTLTVAGTTLADAQSRASAYRFLELFDLTILPMASITATLTGVFLSFVTRWGVLRHWWVVVKLLLAVGVFVAAFAFLHDSAVRAASAGTAGVSAGLAALLTTGFAVAFAAIAAAAVISVYKPWGRTAFGRRQRGDTAKPAAQPAPAPPLPNT